jgi:hypothetical protein
MGTSDRHKWLAELVKAEQGPRVLTPEETPTKQSDREQCVICERKTTTWLHPENAPICSDACLAVYLRDPSVYDPRELHLRPAPRLVVDQGIRVADPPKPAPKKRRKKKNRWEPSDEYVAKAQARIRAEMEARKKDDWD